MQIYSLFMLLGVCTTFLIPETARITLENLAGEYDMGDESMTGDRKLAPGTERGADGSGSDMAEKPAEA